MSVGSEPLRKLFGGRQFAAVRRPLGCAVSCGVRRAANMSSPESVACCQQLDVRTRSKTFWMTCEGESAPLGAWADEDNRDFTTPVIPNRLRALGRTRPLRVPPRS